jgi:flagellar biosynthesis protein FlhA
VSQTSLTLVQGAPQRDGRDVGFAAAIIFILCIFFLPVPAALIDVGLALSIALSVVILMVALWIGKPLEFSSFPTVLLVATLLRLALNLATTRLILSHGAEGVTAAGYIIGGFSSLVMSGDFVIGLIVFLILITVNFLVITKGATRIAEVGARFTLDAIPGKQMAIDADLSAGLIDDKKAQTRRRELEEESAFFGSMDGASKFVRGDAIAGIIILAVNVVGGVIIGVTRHGMSVPAALDVFTKLSVGDGLVSQIPALIVSLAAGLLVSKGGTRGPAERAVLGQLSGYPRALFLAASLMAVLGVVPGLPMTPFALLGGALAFVGYAIPRQQAAAAAAAAALKPAPAGIGETETARKELRSAEIELCFGRKASAAMAASQNELAHRIAQMRRRFARDYGFLVPEIRLTDHLKMPPSHYRIRIHGATATEREMPLGDVLVLPQDGRVPEAPFEETREPAFGMRALRVNVAFAADLKRQGFRTIDPMSVLLTHLSETLRGNLAQLLSYRDARALIEALGPDYKRLVDDICPTHMSYSGLQSVLKLLLAERVSIRNLPQILEAIAEIAPHARRAEQIAEHVRLRLAQQMCSDIADGGALKVLRLGNRWDLAFHQALRRDAKGEVVEFDLEPRLVEQFVAEATEALRGRLAQSHRFALVAAPDARPFVRLIIERSFPAAPVLSHLEIARWPEIESLGTLS